LRWIVFYGGEEPRNFSELKIGCVRCAETGNSGVAESVLLDATHDIDKVCWGVQCVFYAFYPKCVICTSEEKRVVNSGIVRYGVRREPKDRYVAICPVRECCVDGPSIFCPWKSWVENDTSDFFSSQ
jgi:hypothetical protein